MKINKNCNKLAGICTCVIYLEIFVQLDQETNKMTSVVNSDQRELTKEIIDMIEDKWSANART